MHARELVASGRTSQCQPGEAAPTPQTYGNVSRTTGAERTRVGRRSSTTSGQQDQGRREKKINHAQCRADQDRRRRRRGQQRRSIGQISARRIDRWQDRAVVDGTVQRVTVFQAHQRRQPRGVPGSVRRPHGQRGQGEQADADQRGGHGGQPARCARLAPQTPEDDGPDTQAGDQGQCKPAIGRQQFHPWRQPGFFKGKRGILYVCHWLCQCGNPLRPKALAEPVAHEIGLEYAPGFDALN